MAEVITLRQIDVADVPLAVPLFGAYREFYGMPPDGGTAERFLRERLTAGESIVVLANDAGEYVGFSQFFRSFSSVHACKVLVLNDLFVAPAARGKGIASALLKHAETLAQQSGASRLVLETTQSNLAAQALYTRSGWLHDRDALLFHRSIRETY